MKADIHLAYAETTVNCACGQTRSPRAAPRRTASSTPRSATSATRSAHGQQKIPDTGGRVAKFGEALRQEGRPVPRASPEPSQ